VSSSVLPVHAIRDVLLDALARAPVVLTSPTGSGKSTEVPRWCEGRVLVIEPRRIACRSLAMRVAELERTRLGDGCGYVVRDERVMSEATRIVFATPGIALRDRALLASARTIVLDEFHERSLEVDLLLALLLDARRDGGPALIVMSATVEGERVGKHVGGTHVTASGRTFAVDVRHLEGPEVLPDAGDLPARVRTAVDAAARDAGDVLVFLPGKAEIEACARSLEGKALAIVTLHGGLALDEQRHAFEPASRRKVILATNVAETSLTIPGIGVVIDSGLVRQTRYHDGRGFLALVPIAEDSAAQRAGRAGRTGPGVAYRLWKPSARLEKTTPPEIHRESLVPLVMAAAAWGKRPEDLPLLDPPRPYALAAARADLDAWGALDAGALSDGGRSLFALPVAPQHARMLVAARTEGCLDAMIDLVAALSITRPMFVGLRSDDVGGPDDLGSFGCDATALVRAMRAERPSDHGISPHALGEARATRTRLRRLEGLDAVAEATFDREALVRAVVAADPRTVHVARKRVRDATFSNGGTEITLARESAVQRLKDVDAIVVLDTRAFGAGRDQRVLVTAAMAIPLATIARAGLGADRIASVSVEGKRVVSSIERVYAERVVATREDTPSGALAIDAFASLIARGSLFREAMITSRARLARATLAAQLHARGHAAGFASDVPASPEAWLRGRLESLGISSGDDLPMLSASDFLAPELPYEVRETLDRAFPAEVSVGDAQYRASYDLAREEVVLVMVKGSRKDPPPLAYLPRFEGLRICVSSPRGTAVLRERGR
jgi:ATP-dependent helicase HrpB